MYLQAIEIIGFKSFAAKTRLVFEPGITAIVGPNGCGKSNVSDAIRWVLGEQRPTALRGAAMTDVIFNGTDDHKPLSMAEVSITFVDCEEQLGTEYNEVTITRRVFRSGEGQYFINRTPCRLRDIQRLFMDTGIGTTSYSVMAQGQIDAILSSRPEDRRAIFEEASGITRFRADRKEAFRKLEATDQNLARLDDVIHELRRQIGSLQRQAQRARRYREMQGELRRYDLFLTSRRLQELNEKGKSLSEAFVSAQAQTAALREQLSQAENALAEKRREMNDFEQEISAAVETAAEAHNARAHADERLRSHAQRRQENLAWKERDEKESRELSVVRETQIARQQEFSQTLEGANEECAAAQAVLDKARGAFDTLRARSDQAREQLQALRDESVALERNHARLQNELVRTEASAREDLLRRERLAADEARLSEMVQSLSERLDDVSGEYETLQGMVENQLEQVTDAQQKQRREEARIREAQEDLSSLRAESAACEARLKLLEEAARKPEGLPEGARRLLQKENPLSVPEGSVLGLVADQFSAAPEMRRALRAVLRSWMDVVAVRSTGDIPSLLKALHPEGEAPLAAYLLAGDVDTPPSSKAPLEPLPPADVPPGSQLLRPLISCTPGFQKTAEALLHAVYLVPSLPAPGEVPEEICVVTPEGDLLRGRAYAEIWSDKTHSSDAFSRHAQLEDARAEHEHFSDRLTEAQDREESARRALRAAEESLSQARALLEQSQRTAARKEGEERSLSRDLQETRKNLAAITAERKRLEEASAGASDQTRAITGRIEELSRARTKIAETIARDSENARGAETEFLEAQGRLTDARLAYAAVSQRTESTRTQWEAAKLRIAELDGMIESRRKSLASYDLAIEKLDAESAGIREGLATLDENSRAADAAVAALRSARAQEQARAEEAERALQVLRTRIDEAAAAQNRAEISITEVRMQLDHLCERLLSDWDLTPETLAREDLAAWEDGKEPDLEECAQKVHELRRKMEEMGPVNLVAIEDCQKSEERLDFLTTQEADLKDAKEKLLALIKEIDKQSVERFRKTFDQANENFRSMYQRLFGGGTAELRLLDDENLLECGIDIVARPPGKKPQSISLLSGGERTMTAVALLFSIYAIKPSPFAILDELDAALDDSNIGRFVDVLKDFLRLSQFLIITHNQHTIAGADIVYGVTQQEKGISSIISMRLKRVGVEALTGEEMPAPDAPPPPSERKLRGAETRARKKQQ